MSSNETFKWIRSRAAQRRPLNLHEVERLRPDLLKQVFALPNPIGWRACLLAAGVDPHRIVHHQDDLVTCAVCGYSGAVLGTHISSVHFLTGEEYHQEFGAQQELSSEMFRANRFRALAVFGLTHWEHLWSRNYVIDWIITLHSKGEKLNATRLQKHGKALLTMACEYFGGWDEALQSAGIDPEDHRLSPPSQQWTKEKVIERLLEQAAQFTQGEHSTLPNDLLSACQRLFGSLNEALRQANLKRSEVTCRAGATEKEVNQLVASLRTLEHLMGRERRQKMERIVHHPPVNHKIIYGRYGSLQQLAQSHGIRPNAVTARIFRNEDDVHHELDILEKRGLTLNPTTLLREDKRLYEIILKTGWAACRTGRA